VKVIKLHSSVTHVLTEYISLWKERLPNRLQGLYIHGSIVLDAFIESSSDLDFLVITGSRLTHDEVEVISEIHKVIERQFNKPKMDGAFMVWDDMEKTETCMNEAYPYYNDGVIGLDTHFNPITWWLLKNKGITILGPDIGKVMNNIEPHQLNSYVLDNMNSYWAGRLLNLEKSTEQVLQLPENDIEEEVEWTVLGLLRQYYTLKEWDIISKDGAGVYGLLNLAEEWQSIIQEALNIRRHEKVRIFNSKERQIKETIKFSKYIIQYCNSMQED
jgi:hypothetical protein